MENKKGNKLGVLFILLGVLFLLSKFSGYLYTFNMGNVFSVLYRYWPLFFIAIGLSLIFSSRSFVKIIIWIIFIVAIISSSMYFGWFSDYSFHMKNGKFEVKEQEHIGEQILEIEESEEITRGNLEIDLGACEIELIGISEKILNIESSIEKLRVKNEEKKDTVNISVSEKSSVSTTISNNRYVEIEINDEIEWDIDVAMGAASATFDMSDINVAEFNLSLGAGAAKIIYGDANEQVYSTIQGGVSKIEIVVPKESGLKIVSDSGLTIINNDINIASDGDVFTSDNFSEAENKIYLTLELGLSDLTINYQ